MRIYPGRIMNNFLEQPKRQYAIPVYQRNYEWSKEQCIKLFQDIVLAAQRNKEHFCGSVVYALIKHENNIDHYIVIDGQQRMTTVYLLLKAMLDMAQEPSEKATIQNIIINHDPFSQYGIDVASKLKLKPIKSDDRQLLLLMDNQYDQMDKSSGIWRNYELFCQLVAKQQADGMTIAQIYYGLQQLVCVDISLDASDNAQEIFERINSTGVPLSLADKIRNFVLMVDADQEALYEHYWLPAETAVTRENMTAFLLDYLNIRIDGFAREDVAYDVFKDVYERGRYTNQSMLEEILHYAKLYKAFLYGDDQYSERINQLLADLQRLKQTTVFLFLFPVFDDYHAGVIDQTELEKVLEFLRNYSIRRIICEVNSNSLRGLYKTLYARVFVRPDNKQHYYDAIVSFFQQLTSRDALPEDKVFITALMRNNLYRKNALCKFLLASIENQGKEQLVTDNLTIEHILPQNRSLSPAWQAMLGENWQADRDAYLHTLGNLTLTGYNSELGDSSFDKKKEKLSDVQSKVVTLNQHVVSETTWNAEAILRRAQKLSDTIVSLFPIVQPEVTVTFSDPRYQEYTCDDPDNATNKTPNYFILQGERVNCITYSYMLKAVVARLYALDPSIIEGMARRNEHPIRWSQTVLFSYDKDMFEKGYQIPGTDIYENVGFSASYTLCMIRALLDHYEIDRGDFVYSARSTNLTE